MEKVSSQPLYRDNNRVEANVKYFFASYRKQLKHGDGVWRICQATKLYAFDDCANDPRGLEELESEGCNICSVFGKYLLVVGDPDIHCKDYNHLTCEST